MSLAFDVQDAPLRSLFLTIDEIEPGRFIWLIVESGTRDPGGNKVASARTSWGTYGDALEQGVAELKRYSGGNLLVGPRRGNESDYPSVPAELGFHILPQ